MDAISLYKKYKFSYIHPQMSSVYIVWICPLCTPTPDASFINISLFIVVPCIRENYLTDEV